MIYSPGRPSDWQTVAKLQFSAFYPITSIDQWASQSLREACYQKNRLAANHILSMSAFAFLPGPGGKNALHMACLSRALDLIELVADKSKQTFERLSYSHPLSFETPSHQLQAWSQQWFFDFINAPDEAGQTPLHLACRKNYEDVAALLLSLGVNPHPVDQFSNTPMDLCTTDACRLLFSEHALHSLMLRKQESAPANTYDALATGEPWF